MTKKIVKKKKLRLSRVLLLLIVITLIGIIVYCTINSKIKNIIIKGNIYITDEEILKKANIEDYPRFFLTLSSTIKDKIENIPIIKKAKVEKSFLNTITITVEEYDILLKNNLTNKYVLSNKEEIDYPKELNVPSLTNEVNEKKYKSLISNLELVNDDILSQISEIKYVPNEYDKDRFLLYMNDDNSVYLTLTKFEMINYYNKVLPQLEGRKGILYLDSGNHFKIMQ